MIKGDKQSWMEEFLTLELRGGLMQATVDTSRAKNLSFGGTAQRYTNVWPDIEIV